MRNHFDTTLLFGRAVLILSLLHLSAACAPRSSAEELGRGQDRARVARFQAALDSLREDYRFVGATAAYVLADGTVRAFATGLADAERQISMTPESRLLSGSIGKTFVAALALDLAAEGRLGLDDRVSGWLGEEPWYPRLPNGRSITLRHLLTHSAGLADHVYEPAFQEAVAELLARRATDPDRTFSPAELIGFILDREPLFPPGEGFSYTDTGYLIAGLVLERAAQAPYYEELERRFLDPLALELTSPSNRRHLEGLAVGYLHEGVRGAWAVRVVDEVGALVINPALEWTGGGLVTNSRDLVRWAKALYEGEAIEGDYLDELLGSGYRGDDRRATYGLGVFLYDTPFGPAWGHGGWFPGYNSVLRYFPEHRIAVAMQVNRDYGNDRSEFAHRLMAAVLGAD